MPEKKQTEGRGAYEWVQALVCSVLTVVLIFTFAVRIVRVSGESMRETLQDQDMLVVLNNWLCGGYEQGDIVILQRDDFYGGEPIVKRVIATEGQTVDIDFDAGAGRALYPGAYLDTGGNGISLDGAGGLRFCHGRQPQRQ
mgnify:CR=1 FL=1